MTALGYVRIGPEHASALARALERAHVAGIASDWLDHYTIAHPDNSLDTLLVSSSSEPGRRYEVTVRVAGRDVRTRCQCRAGEVGRICQHVALALDIMGLTQALVTAPLRRAAASTVVTMTSSEAAVAA